jgi:hypothetical protein
MIDQQTMTCHKQNFSGAKDTALISLIYSLSLIVPHFFHNYCERAMHCCSGIIGREDRKNLPGSADSDRVDHSHIQAE